MGLKSSNSTSELVKHDSEGQCNSKCKTIEQVCQEVIGYLDTDVAEYLYNSKPDTDSLYKYLCKDPTKACSTKPPPVPKTKKLPPVWKYLHGNKFTGPIPTELGNMSKLSYLVYSA
ncbi:hypothetical protein HN51_004933 [Arachis hypogaea]